MRVTLGTCPAVRLALAAFVLAAAPLASAETLFSYGGKAYTDKDLAPAEQQALYDVRYEAYTKEQALTEQAALNLYLDAQAKKAHKTRQEYEKTVLAVKDPTDKQIKAWYDSNKQRIPPSLKFEQIKGQIKELLMEQARKVKRDDLLAKVKKEKKFKVALTEPVSPVVEIATAGYPAKGADKAKATLVEFADYQCPHCKEAMEPVDAILKQFKGKVRLVFMDFPIKGEVSNLLAQGAYCAGQQGKFWEYHDAAYDKQASLYGKKDAPTTVAKALKLDEAKFKTCLTSDAAKKHVEASRLEGERLGINGTPTIYLNGRRVKSFEKADLAKDIASVLKG